MNFEIKHRWSGAVLFSCELSAEVGEKEYRFQLGFAVVQAVKSDANLSDANLRDANLSGANLSGAYLSGANLSDANLRGANLRDANLSGANLRDANLSGAYLSGANLRDANLSGAYLRGAYLSDADLRGADLRGRTGTPEEVARLDAVRAIVLNKPGRLRMDTWHTENWTPEHTPQEEHTCGSAHCIAGWLQALSDDPKIRAMDPEMAGWKMAPCATHMFYASSEAALTWLTERQYAPKVEA